ncbi:SCO6745 family protein [Mycobacterium sp.]|uniref:SCO6745 family protein n=1 Tax=Mycobacterium sp. TaxID=1785 RepID=UPI003A89236B
MSTDAMFDAARAAGAPIEEAIGLFMLHPETFAESVAAGYTNPLAGYVAGRAGVLGEASAAAVDSAFVVFEPATLGALWGDGVAVHGATGAAERYWEQLAGFARRHLTGAEGLGRIAELGEKIIAAVPNGALPLFAGWRTMPLADDAPARALQVMFVLREMRAGVHFNALNLSGISAVEAHMLNKGAEYTRMFGWPEPFADGADKKDLYSEVEQWTNRRMAQIYTDALDAGEAAELARFSTAALAALKADIS